MDNIYQAAPVLGIVAAFTVTLVGSIALTLLARQINFLRKFVSV
jgi:hypothetical protein